MGSIDIAVSSKTSWRAEAGELRSPASRNPCKPSKLIWLLTYPQHTYIPNSGACTVLLSTWAPVISALHSWHFLDFTQFRITGDKGLNPALWYAYDSFCTLPTASAGSSLVNRTCLILKSEAGTESSSSKIWKTFNNAETSKYSYTLVYLQWRTQTVSDLLIWFARWTEFGISVLLPTSDHCASLSGWIKPALVRYPLLGSLLKNLEAFFEGIWMGCTVPTKCIKTW